MRYLLIILLFPLLCQGQIFTSYTSAAIPDPCNGETSIDWDEADGSGPYDIISIGDQCWFTRSLNVGTRINYNTAQTDNSVREKYCYGNTDAFCDQYGGLYQWEEAAAYENSDFWSGTRGLCPNGWHIPTESDYQTLIDFLGGTSVAGSKLKETGTESWTRPNSDATNSSGFSARGGGAFNGGQTVSIEDNGIFWSSSYYLDGGGQFGILSLGAANGWAEIIYPYPIDFGVSIRCLKD